MDRDIEKVKEREKRRWDEYSHNDHPNDSKPMNDAIGHLRSIGGYPVNKPAKIKSLPLRVRILGYLLMGFMALGFLAIIVLNFI